MLLSSVITASLYGRREFWVAEARDMNSRRTIVRQVGVMCDKETDFTG